MRKKTRVDGFYHFPDPDVCPICKKYFYPAPMHAYKIGPESEYEFVCSYHCMRAWEKDKTIYKLKRRKKEVYIDEYID